MNSDPPPLTWEQARRTRCWPARAFQAVGIPAGTIRRWASEGYIHPIAKGPNGAMLYDYASVVQHAETTGYLPRRGCSNTMGAKG